MGSTPSLTSQYSTMLITHSHSPPAALDLCRMMSGLKSLPSRMCLTFLKLTRGTCCLSILDLNADKSVRNWLRSFIITVAAFHEVSGFLPSGAVRQMTAAVTSSMPGGGFESDFSSESSLRLSESSAAAALSRDGWAACRSSSMEALRSTTARSFSSALAATSAAMRLSSAASSFCSAMRGTSASHSSFFTSTSCCFVCSCCSSKLTDSAVAWSFSTPDW
mmetsp:Transcript_3628/g.10490  ORF Transcript_3628/g.10490 Transcript_3628/m.10490 type:complete len:220 (+) Transcript_3628:1284-1943(+)